MDPNETLRVMRELSALILEGNADSCDVVALAEHVQAFHNWVMRGGFLPTEWLQKS